MHIQSTEFKVCILTVESQGFGMQNGKKRIKLSEYGRKKTARRLQRHLLTENTAAEKKSWGKAAEVLL